ncbi:MAG: nickel pincer cofactor biosynthesis protein LarC [bacterium]
MKIAYLDTISGISGDMTLAAFVSAGLSIDRLIEELRKLSLSGFEVEARHHVRSGITATALNVVISEQSKYHRHLKDINAIIDNSTLSERVKRDAKAIFAEVAVAEAKVHNSTIEKVHFHEVGAIDSIVDIIGTAICLEYFGVEQVYSSPVKLGHGGVIQTQHGTMPIPTPATLEILKGYPTILTTIPHELTTPTGAAIVKALSKGTLSTEQLRIEAIGYGAGTREIAEVPNLLRVMIGELHLPSEYDEVHSIETNIDDMNPEILPVIAEQLFAAGALDVFMTQVLMKKSRPGILLTTLVERSKLDPVVKIILNETSTLGVRIHTLERRKLKRGEKTVTTSFGTVNVKSIVRNGRESLVPEFEECKRIASEKKLPLLEVYKILEREIG